MHPDDMVDADVAVLTAVHWGRSADWDQSFVAPGAEALLSPATQPDTIMLRLLILMINIPRRRSRNLSW